ncbi:MAG: hypothetical protein QM791_03730 [Ferruginibacter sp.]
MKVYNPFMQTVKPVFLLLSMLTVYNAGFAQAGKDTAKKQTIDITSSYKPVLRNSVKINFSATQLNADTSKSIQAYNIPAQNLFYTYQPGSLKPLALQLDTALELGDRNFIKAGFGNYTTPYVKAGFSFGDGKTSLLNIYGDFISSIGSIRNQDFSAGSVKAAGSYFTPKSEVYGSATISQQDHYLYGYDHTAHSFIKSEILQRFQDFDLKGGIRNREATGSGINYSPNLEVILFNNKDKASERTFIAEVPIEKTIDDVFSARLAVKADLTSYSTKNLDSNVKFGNNIFHIAPEIVYAKPLFNIHAGITPTWDNGKVAVFPNIYGEAQLLQKSFLVQAGLTGRFVKNTFRNLTAINPYLQTIDTRLNTKEIELYGGIKATLNKHFNFSAKAGLIRYTNFPFFVNDTADGKTFVLSNDSKVTDLRLHADLSFISQDKFTITGGLTFNGYTGMQNNDKAWGTIPLELNASMRWWAFKKVLIKGDFMAFSGGPYLLKDGTNKTLSGAADLSAGVEITLTKNISAWADINNIFNNKYQRWHNYPVYGLNALAGVIVRF